MLFTLWHRETKTTANKKAAEQKTFARRHLQPVSVQMAVSAQASTLPPAHSDDSSLLLIV